MARTLLVRETALIRLLEGADPDVNGKPVSRLASYLACATVAEPSDECFMRLELPHLIAVYAEWAYAKRKGLTSLFPGFIETDVTMYQELGKTSLEARQLALKSYLYHGQLPALFWAGRYSEYFDGYHAEYELGRQLNKYRKDAQRRIQDQ